MNRPTTLHVAQDEQREAAPPAFGSANFMQAVNMGLQAILAALSASIFTLDVVSGSRIGFELLYLGVILAAALSRNGATIRNWTGSSLGLALLAFAAVHRTQVDWLEVVQLVLSIGAIGVTGTILVRLNELDGVKIALEASQSELQAFSDNVPQLLWRARPDGYCDFLNRRYAEMMGLDPEAAIREQSWGRLFHPDDAARVQQIWENGFRAGEDFQFYGRKRTADQSYRWYHIVGRAARHPVTGEITAWYGGSTDVHDEIIAREEVKHLNETLEERVKERTSELEEAGRRFDVLWNQTSLAFGEHDVSEAKIVLDKLKAEGVTDFLAYVAAHPEVRRVCIAGVKTLNINDAFVKLLGYEDKSEMLTKRPQENLAREDNAILGLLAALFEGRDSCQGEVVLVGKDETRVPVAFQISMPSPTRCIVGVMDISERKRLEELQMEAQSELARANRVATMGAFTASLAHELNQPITAVMINAGNARRWLTRHPPMTDAALNSIDRIAAHAERAASIVRRTREQIVGAKRELAPVDLCKLAQETKVLLEWELKSRRTLLTVACQQGASVVLGDRIELQQVLINIIVNAADAVQDLDDRQRNVHIMVTPNGDDTVQLTISDTGQGIPSELIDKIFDPFFSTKEGGMGMGLQVCQSIIESMGGTISASNRSEGGAEFKITLDAIGEH